MPLRAQRVNGRSNHFASSDVILPLAINEFHGDGGHTHKMSVINVRVQLDRSYRVCVYAKACSN